MEEESQENTPAPKPPKKKIDLKPKEMEIRVENDTRQVIKKKPIVFGDKKEEIDVKLVGPKLPSQESHRGTLVSN